MWRCGPVVRALRVSRPELRSLSGKNSVVAFRPAPVHLAPTPTLSLIPSRSYRKHRGPISTLRLPKHVTKTTSVYDHINSQVLGGVIAPPPNFETLKRFPPTVNVRHDKPERLKLPREDLLREFYERNPLMKLEPIDFTDDHVSLAEKFIAAQEEYMLEGMEQEDAYNRCLERFNTEMLAVETYLRGLQTEGAKLTDKTLLSVYFRRIGSTRELKEAKTISAGARKGTLPSDWENEMYESVDIPSVDPERRAEENAEIKEFNAAWQAQKLWQQAVEQEQAGLPSASEQGLGGQNREDRAFAAGDRLSMTAELVARQHKDERQRVFLFNQLGNARGALLSSLPLSLSMEFRELEDDREMVAQAYRFTAPGFTKMAYELCDLLDETYEYRSAFLMGNEIDLATQETNLPDDGDNANDDHSFADISEAYKASVRAQAVKPQATESSGASPVTGASPSPIAAALANAGPEVEVPKLDESTLKTESRRNLDEFASFPLLMSKLMEGNLTEEDLNLSAEELAALGDDGKLLLARIQSGDIKHPLDIFSESERQQLAQMSRDGDFSPEKLAAIAGASTEEFQFSLDHLQDTIKIGQIYERDPTRGAALFLNKPTVDEFRNHLQEMKTMEEQAEALRPIIVAFERARHDYAVLLGQEGKTDGVPLPELFQERLAAGHARPSDVDTYHATDFTKTLDAFLTREGLAASRRKQEEDEEVPMRAVPKKLRPVVALAEERKYFNDLRLQRKQQYFDMLPEKAAELEQAAIERQEQMAKNFLSRSK